MKKIICCILFILTAAQMLLLSGCRGNKTKYSDYSFDFFDTATTINGFESDEETFKANSEKIKQKLDEYHKLYTIYSRYDNLNNLTVINQVTGGIHQEVKVDSKIIEMLTFAGEMCVLTDGNVNVAMGSVLSIWHNYREAGLKNPSAAKLPSMDELREASKYTDFDKVVIDKEKNTVFIADPNVTLDVGAIAKGYAVEQVARWMKNEGMDGYLLNVGGNIRTVGKRPDGKKWQIGIENPDTDNKDLPYIEYLAFSEMSLVTSGSYQRFYTVDGNNYHHIIDPSTLMPAENFKLLSVACKDSGKGDALSTALFCMSYEDGRKLVDSIPDIEAMWVLNSGEKRYSKNFKSLTFEMSDK